MYHRHHHLCSKASQQDWDDAMGIDEVTRELIRKGKNVIKDFDMSKKLVVHPKRRSK